MASLIDNMSAQRLSFALRFWRLLALALASGFGAMYCAAKYALAASISGSKYIVSNPGTLDHWRRVAMILSRRSGRLSRDFRRQLRHPSAPTGG